ncbi:MFS transporter [Comamonas sp. JUb58]|uniref:MFS transporter n=1 Tax=Comamonas sp. JUb58 TaxID=2485114 RepID=UPI0010608F74|nr:MFS transporter [Comamonas sp. JUb58]TDS76327.1 putative MFS family arabinose efflux permease [Comamonas sp. JUb58]
MRRITADNATFGVFLAFLLIPLSGIGTDIYLPSMPAMAQSLGGTASQIQLTLTLFIAGYGLGQLVVGVLLDRFGRWRPTMVALALFALSSAAIAVSDDIVVICALRLLQGLLGAVAVVGKRTFFVDVFRGPALQRYLTWMTVVWSLGPICAPFIGGFVQTHWGWRANFVVLAVFSVVALVLEMLGGGETLAQPQPIRPREVASRAWEIMRNRAFARGVLCVSAAYAMVMGWSMASPFIVEAVYHRPPTTTGSLALLMGLAWMGGGLIARAAMARSLAAKHRGALLAMACFISLLALTTWLPASWPSLAVMAAVAFCIHVAAGLVFNIHFAHVLSMFPKHAALSGGIAGGLAFLLTSLLASLGIHLVNPQTGLGLAAVYGGLALLLVGAWLTMLARPAPAAACATP